MGGAAPIMKKGRELYDKGKYLHATEILNKLVYAEPGNQAAKDLLADCFEQIGYQKESTSLRNSFLAAALELRSGIPAGIAPRPFSPDVIRALTTDLWLDLVAILLDSKKADGLEFTMNLVTPDNGEQYAVELSNATLSSIKGFQAKHPDVTLTINRADLETVMLGKATFAQQVAAGKARIEGNPRPLEQLMGMLVRFPPDFEIMPGTKAVQPAVTGAH
jgi:alkyl sulfatase BDS1-like metallo-beta-lactamase superfamily hydrolase